MLFSKPSGSMSRPFVPRDRTIAPEGEGTSQLTVWVNVRSQILSPGLSRR
jgi:hypothetical protein